VLNLETNEIVETCEVTFDETEPRSQLVFECAGDDELGEEIFQDEEHEHGDNEDGGAVPPVEHDDLGELTFRVGRFLLCPHLADSPRGAGGQSARLGFVACSSCSCASLLSIRFGFWCLLQPVCGRSGLE
jgi:hypothetical protein